MCEHVERQIDATDPKSKPFRHLYIEDVFPSGFYSDLREFMLFAKYGGELQSRCQDSGSFVNQRFSLADRSEGIVRLLRYVFDDVETRYALVRKFYHAPDEEFIRSLVIHHEFEFFFTKAGRFQNIHVDIPPKMLSLVFYIPEVPFSSTVDEVANATILYDRELCPHNSARFRPNSVCVFAPHFHSYHGFNATLDRDVLVMFLVLPDEMARWRELRQTAEVPPYTMIRDVLLDKMRRYPLLEFGREELALREAYENCRINAPQGRIVTRPGDSAK